MDEEPICPVCYTGVLKPMGDMAGHLVCSVCFAQSQDVILEEMDDYISAEEKGCLRANKPAGERKIAGIEVKTIDAQAEVMVYLECLQRLLQAQQEVISKWFSSKAYEGVLKQIWKLTVLHSGLLDVGHLKGFFSPEGDVDDDWDQGEPKQGAPTPGEDDTQGPTRRTKTVKMSANSHNLGAVLYTCTKKLSMMTTFACHLLAAWTLKLPMWAKDILEAARDGDLPFLAAITLCEDLLEGHPVAQRALRHPYFANSDSGLVAVTHNLASSINVVVPELNLAAFVHRHCASLGLPIEVAKLATHLALSRQANTREHGMPEHVKKRCKSAWASAQYVQVFFPILAVCKHLLRLGPMLEEAADHFTADSVLPWVQASQRLLELRQLKHKQRYEMAFRHSVDDMLEYTHRHSLHDCTLPAALDKVQQVLKISAHQLEQHEPATCKHDQDEVGLCGAVMVDTGNATDIAAQMYGQLIRLVAIEIGSDVSTVDVMMVQYYKDLLQV